MHLVEPAISCAATRVSRASGVAIGGRHYPVDIPEIPLPVDQRITQRPPATAEKKKKTNAYKPTVAMGRYLPITSPTTRADFYSAGGVQLSRRIATASGEPPASARHERREGCERWIVESA